MCRAHRPDRRCDSSEQGKARRRFRYAEKQARVAVSDGDTNAYAHYASSSAQQLQDLIADHDHDVPPDVLPENLEVDAARMFATHAHEGQYRRDGQPYVVHPEGVADRLQRAGLPSHVVAAGWLHDVVEDTDYTLGDLRAVGFRRDIVAIVESLTHRNGEDYRTATMPRAVRTLDSAAVKDADNQHNTSDLRGPTPAEYAKQMRRNEKYLAARRTIKARLYNTPDGQRELQRVFAAAS